MYNFSRSFKIPDYLEEILAPFAWSGIFSDDFRDSILNIIMAQDPVAAAEEFSKSLETLMFLDSGYKIRLIDALTKYAKERKK